MWIVHAPEGVYSAEDKKNITEAITQIYVEFVDLPKFYVVVRFDEYPVDSMWLGGEPVNDFVRFVVDHIARQMDDPAFRELPMTVFCDRLAPFTGYFQMPTLLSIPFRCRLPRRTFSIGCVRLRLATI